MKVYKTPFFRKLIIPWYDSDVACGILIAVSVLVLLFSAMGIRTVLSMEESGTYIWLPSLLAALSFFLMMKIIVKLVMRKRLR